MASPRKSVKKAPELIPEPLPDFAAITVTLERATGRVKVDETFSTPMETWAMLSYAASKRDDDLQFVNEITD